MYRRFTQLLKCSSNLKCLESKSFLQFSYNFHEVLTLRSLLGRSSPSKLKCSKCFSLFYPVTDAFKMRGRYFSQQNEHLVQVDENNSEETSPELFNNIDFDEITGGDSEAIDRFKLLLLEVDVLRQDGVKVPSKLSTEKWKELFSLQSRSQRRKMLAFLWTVEMKKLSDLRKKEVRKLAMEERAERLNEENKKNDHIRYGFQGNTIFIRLYDTTLNMLFNNRLVQAMQFGQNIVVDCGFDSNMTTVENKLCGKQLMLVFAENRMNEEPFNINFCNVNKNSIMYKQFNKFIPTIDDPAFPIIIEEKSYLDLFPKEKLVYLTPHCRTELKEFSHDDIYIIGGIVDRQNNEPLTLAKAKSEGIRMAHLPLDRYLDWGLGGKSLTINQVVNILLTVRTTGDWNAAFKHVPKRKVRIPGETYRDPRKFYSRGTTFQPPQSYRGNSKRLTSVSQPLSFDAWKKNNKNKETTS